MKIAKESLILILVGMTDLVTTLWWVNSHGAEEANPIFSHYLAMGPVIFALMKMLMLFAPIFLLEWARRRRPRFTLYASRFAIAAYLSLYVVGFTRLNPPVLREKPTPMTYQEMAQTADTSTPIDAGTVRHLRFLMRMQKLGLVD